VVRSRRAASPSRRARRRPCSCKQRAGTAAQAGSLLLGAVAQSRGNSAVRAEDARNVTIDSVRAATAQWQPTALTIVSGTVGLADLTIENTGNTETTFGMSFNAIANVTATLPFTQIVLPLNGKISVPVDIVGRAAGNYQLAATVTGGATSVQANLVLLNRTGRAAVVHAAHAQVDNLHQ